MQKRIKFVQPRAGSKPSWLRGKFNRELLKGAVAIVNIEPVLPKGLVFIGGKVATRAPRKAIK